jgi:hypothetical protein
MVGKGEAGQGEGGEGRGLYPPVPPLGTPDAFPGPSSAAPGGAAGGPPPPPPPGYQQTPQQAGGGGVMPQAERPAGYPDGEAAATGGAAAAGSLQRCAEMRHAAATWAAFRAETPAAAGGGKPAPGDMEHGYPAGDHGYPGGFAPAAFPPRPGQEPGGPGGVAQGVPVWGRVQSYVAGGCAAGSGAGRAAARARALLMRSATKLTATLAARRRRARPPGPGLLRLDLLCPGHLYALVRRGQH